MASESLRSTLESMLWPAGDGANEVPCYAILDAASHHSIHPKLFSFGVEGSCLHESECAPDFEEFGAHFVLLENGSPLTEWILDEVPGQNWGIFLRATGPVEPLREHLKMLLSAELPDGKVVWFRYYDPRVLAAFLPGCSDEELAEFFGPIQEILSANDPDGDVQSWVPQASSPTTPNVTA